MRKRGRDRPKKRKNHYFVRTPMSDWSEWSRWSGRRGIGTARRRQGKTDRNRVTRASCYIPIEVRVDKNISSSQMEEEPELEEGTKYKDNLN